jgi:hypothetical protein
MLGVENKTLIKYGIILFKMDFDIMGKTEVNLIT